ncbi:MAG: IS200/IS605 family transposase [Bacteroidales bacterium]|jgi:putative transposase
MSFVRIYVHLVWATRERYPFLYSSELRVKVWKHIKENAEDKGIFVDVVNGYSDHCHCLVSLSANQTISKVANLIKGESSRWINQNELIDEKFEWQDKYFAVSVSESMIDKVRNYIIKQESHHKRQTFADECNELIEGYNFKTKK